MKSAEWNRALKVAVRAARQAGRIMRRNFDSKKHVSEARQFDLKLDLDVKCQRLIERTLRSAFPNVAVLGEEGTTGDVEAPVRWVVDPIDGTVNYAYGIPHCCVSIALQVKTRARANGPPDLNFETVAAAVYDPFCEELWTAVRGRAARLNGRPIHVSSRDQLKDTLVSIGFSKHATSLKAMLPAMGRLVPRVRKVRMMGSAALALAYVASARTDGYVESGVRLWDIAAGGLILECAGGEFWRAAIAGEHNYRIIANNGLLRRKLQRLL